ALDVANRSLAGEREVDLPFRDERGIEVRAALHQLALQEADVEPGMRTRERLLEEGLQVTAGIRERRLQEGEGVRLQPDRATRRRVLDQPALHDPALALLFRTGEHARTGPYPESEDHERNQHETGGDDRSVERRDPDARWSLEEEDADGSTEPGHRDQDV